MRIQPIFYSYHTKKQNFKGDLPHNMREIFANPDIPANTKRTLWELSEIPYFCEASENSSQGDLLRISKIVKNAPTNVVKLALEDAIEISQGKKRQSLLSLKKVAEFNSNAQPYEKKKLLELIRKMPLQRLEQDVEKSYKTENDYPVALSYKLPISGLSLRLVDDASIKRAIENGLVEEKDKDIDVIFRKQLKYKGEVNPQYYPTPKELIEEPLTQTPDNVKKAYHLAIATLDNNKSLSRLEEIPYFNNLAKDTEPIKINVFAEWNHKNDNIFEKMLSKDITLEVYNPRGKTLHIPIIDAERLLADKKFKIYDETDLFRILDTQTMAFEIYRCYEAMKGECPNDRIESIVFKMQNGKVGIICYTLGEDSSSGWLGEFNADNPDQRKIRAFLEKMPMKTTTITFIPQEDIPD